MREHTAVVVIPFTTMLLCNDMTGERARVAQSPPPWRPGLPAVNRRFAVPSAYSFRLIGYGRRQRPCKARPLGASMRLAPAYRKRLSDLQPDQGVAVSYSFLIRNVHRFRKKITGDPSARGRGAGMRASDRSTAQSPGGASLTGPTKPQCRPAFRPHHTPADRASRHTAPH
jgi:hypothetical protein